MEIIENTNNALEFINSVNSNLSLANINKSLTSTMNATEVINILNDAFKTLSNAIVLTLSMNSCDFIQAVNTNFEQLIEDSSKSSIKFLHISDIHNLASADAITECKKLMDNDSSIEFTFLTGDYTGYNGSYSNMTEPLKQLNGKLLALNGNHDIYDGFNNKQSNATSYLKGLIENSNVIWGDFKDVASYYYKDISIDTDSKLRIFSMDSYDYQYGIGSKYDTVYSQEQIDWVISKIMELKSSDYFLIAMHEPPVNATIDGPSYNVSGQMDEDIVSLRRVNDFCSSRLWTWDTSFSNGNLFPIIVDAYLNKKNINETIINENSVTKGTISTVKIKYDFSTLESTATFLFYMGGHLHGDMAAYHPKYTEQLILLVDCGSNTTLGQSSDIGTRATDTTAGTRENGKLINQIELDFKKKQIIINRIGQNQALSYNGFTSITRKEIIFPFKKI